ncbi:MAG: UDP-N-acetylmuramoyl-L-alanyl-D-glutamate--2,6-diaminopimelate ligase [Acidimicrobiales bacterium]|nr:UDP-N-acetylmuramoyl-L-alanyl-D-glutamate--2,6-diaminopimelate ligase [Acidimicrobiales bacterium]
MELASALADSSSAPALAGALVVGDPTVDVTRLDHDSRLVGPGSMFCCVPGERLDGHDFAPAAVAAGATALLCERPLGLGVPEVQVASVRAAMGPLAAAVHGHPSAQLAVVGITGTNGKTTVAHLLAAILEAAGRRCGVIGTLTGARTTPEAPELQARFAALLAEGHDSVAMEVSSHALQLQRVDGTRFRVAVFTNLSRDHLDFHGDMESYFQAKAKLFDPRLSDRAVVNLDSPHGRLLRDAATIPTVGFSLDDATDLQLGPAGSAFTWRGETVRLGLAGRFNVSNALAAATAAAELGLSAAEVAAGLAMVPPVPGRFELVDEGQPFLVVVDYAHTPDGLEQVLLTARELAGSGRVLAVFGAGGNRDRTKRPAMGAAVAEGADLAVLTTDNPRGEDPAAIMADVHEGLRTANELLIEPDRRAAIAAALARAEPGDVVVVAGKGHETTQTIGRDVLPFDDRAVARELLRAAGHPGPGTAR